MLPENVAFKLAPEEYVVMQIHYKNPFKEPDHSGVTAKISSIQPKYFAGIYLLWRFSLNIPAGVPETSGDMNCRWNQNIPLNIFAFRPHAHSLGKRIIGKDTRILSWPISPLGSFTNYFDKILAFFDHLPTCFDIFYGMNIEKIWTF